VQRLTLRRQSSVADKVSLIVTCPTSRDARAKDAKLRWRQVVLPRERAKDAKLGCRA
jgi:hypothetical protein